MASQFKFWYDCQLTDWSFYRFAEIDQNIRVHDVIKFCFQYADDTHHFFLNLLSRLGIRDPVKIKSPLHNPLQASIKT